MNATEPAAPWAERVRRLEARLAREQRARTQAEQIIESKSLELWEANRALSGLAAELESRVAERTQELSRERHRALQLAETDALTGVANRACFNQQLAHALQASRTGGGGSLIMLDLDGFKAINDAHGHATGDALLVAVARRMAAAVRPSDVVARLGGDEFALIVRDGTSAGPDVAERLLRALAEPVVIDGRRTHTGCSIGVAHFGPDTHDADALLRDADLALYTSKRQGRGRATVFDQALRSEVSRRHALQDEVRRAVAEERIEPWYQPVYDQRRGAYVGAEMLARWHHGDGMVRTPAQFLAAVEGLDLLDAMTESMLRRALVEARPHVEAGLLAHLAVNVSPAQFNRGWAQQRLPRLLAETGYPAQALVVEITETALLQDAATTGELLRALKAEGLRLALDDFGVGYSNFSLLRRLPIDLLKLDRTLVCDIVTDANARALAECVLDLAAKLHIDVVAEGVEDEAQARLLAEAGCACMQGFWFARPARRLETWFRLPQPVRKAASATAAALAPTAHDAALVAR
ncbi:MAG: EAL domain-containing protein [Rubrivivax sp.]|nr:EAL domain-containing protein [Rubrivivax sp.]